MSQQQLLKQGTSVSRILRTYGKQFMQIRNHYSDGHNGRCAVAVIMSYFGWNDKDDFHAASKLSGASIVLRHVGLTKNWSSYSTILVYRLMK